MRSYEVIVVGGGFSGVAAAIAAAREGAKVLLIEQGNSLGGAATRALVTPFMKNATKLDGVYTELSQGIFKEIFEKLQAEKRTETDSGGATSFLEEDLKFILNDMVLSSNIRLLYHAYLCGVQKNDGKIQEIQHLYLT